MTYKRFHVYLTVVLTVVTLSLMLTKKRDETKRHGLGDGKREFEDLSTATSTTRCFRRCTSQRLTLAALPFFDTPTAQKIGTSAQITTRLSDGSKPDCERATRFLL
jgi:hypothetical protein